MPFTKVILGKGHFNFLHGEVIHARVNFFNAGRSYNLTMQELTN